METKNNKNKCPKCAVGILNRRAKRPFWMKTLFFWLPIKRYECGSCFRRSYVFGSYGTRNAVEA
ncbi:hypothetical protein [Mucilaginibacter sp.]|uniref:hypothetical protein n=1 Tax=Mucilaginibacter sp. TaxID=1882438 RepID=UPI0032652457